MTKQTENWLLEGCHCHQQAKFVLFPFFDKLVTIISYAFGRKLVYKAWKHYLVTKSSVPEQRWMGKTCRKTKSRAILRSVSRILLIGQLCNLLKNNAHYGCLRNVLFIVCCTHTLTTCLFLFRMVGQLWASETSSTTYDRYTIRMV